MKNVYLRFLLYKFVLKEFGVIYVNIYSFQKIFIFPPLMLNFYYFYFHFFGLFHFEINYLKNYYFSQ